MRIRVPCVVVTIRLKGVEGKRNGTERAGVRKEEQTIHDTPTSWTTTMSSLVADAMAMFLEYEVS